MYATHAPSSTLLDLAATQEGVLSCEQVLGLGGSNTMIRRLVRDGRWYRIAAGIVSTSAAPQWIAWVWAGILLGGSSAVVGGAAAAHLHGIGPEPDAIDIWSGEKSPRWRPPWRFHRGARPGRGEPTKVSIEEATLDICSMGELDQIASALSSAITARRTTPTRLRSSVLAQPYLRHRQLILAMLADVSAGAESPLEVRYLRDVERAHRLPAGQRQVSVSSRTRTDVGYLDQLVLVELDGQLGHSGDGMWRDMARDNSHAIGAGFTTLRYGWHDVVRRPCEVAWQVGEALTLGGWSGTPSRCRNCRKVHTT